MKPYTRKRAFSLPILQSRQKPFQVADCAIDATVPQTPLHRSDVLVDGGKRFEKARAGSNDLIGDLLHRLDLHGDVEPVNDVGRRLRHGAWQALQDFSAVRDHSSSR